MISTQLLVLGNGFDLHCGLKSSYKDFFRYAILDEIEEHYSVVQMKYRVSGFWISLLFEYYKLYGDNDYKWCDIEKIISDIMCLIILGDNKNELHFMNSGIGKHAFDCSKSERDLDIEIKSFSDPIKKFVFLYCVRFFNVYLQQKANYPEQDVLHKLYEHFLQELRNFEKRFCKYLKSCIFDKQNNINELYIVNAVNLLARLTGFSSPDYEDIDDIMETEERQVWEDITPQQRISRWKKVKVLLGDFAKLRYTNILSFNYTALFDVLAVESPCVYSNVHGKLCSKQCSDDCMASSVIFGIDDIVIQAHDINSDLHLFSKTYRKMPNTSSPISILPPKNKNPIEIKFYGHSLSEADYSYFQSIFDFYDIYGNNNVSLIFYYSKGYEQTDAIYRLINVYGKTFNNKDQGKNLIHKLLLENRLKIVDVADDI